MSAVEPLEQLGPTILEAVPAAPYIRLLEEAPTLDTKFGPETYELLCLAIKDPETDEVCIVRKSNDVDSAESEDWLVLRYKPKSGEMIRNEVISSKTDTGHNGDIISLVLSPEVSHHGPFTLTFGVDDMYRPNGQPASLKHLKYHGRGVGSEPEMQDDAIFTEPLLLSERNATVYYLDKERENRRYMGQSAIAGY